MIDLPETHYQRERGRLSARGRGTEGGGWCTMLAVQQADSSWTVRISPWPGVTLAKADMVALAEAILECAR